MEIEQNSGLSIFCPICGSSFIPSQSQSNICIQCILSQGDISQGITKESILNQCRNCKRYQKPPYVYCERESKELLALCLKKIRGLNSVKIIDACFIYTEPHSRRVKVKVTVQKEVLKDINVQQCFVVEFTEHNQQCDDCKKEFTPHTWGAVVQLRQHVDHKKTLFYLEQVILKHNAHDKCVKVNEEDHGMDFFFKNRQHAGRLVDFLETFIACQQKNSKQLLNTDHQNGTQTYKFSYALIIPKICKDDLVIVTDKIRKQLGASSCLLICLKVQNYIKLLDPISYNIYEITDKKYFEYEQNIKLISFQDQKTEFMVINSEIDTVGRGNNTSFQTMSHKSVNLEIARTSDWNSFQIKSHLGDIFKSGDIFYGFDLEKINAEEVQEIQNLPQAILIRKQRTKESKRIYKLKRMDMNQKEEEKKKKKGQKVDVDQQFEDFMEILDQDKELRKDVLLYADQKAIEEKKKNSQLRKKNKEKKQEQQQEFRKKLQIKKQFEDSKASIKQKSLNNSKNHLIKNDQSSSDEEWEDEDGININDLIKDLHINDNDDIETTKGNEKIVDDFIKQLDKIKISK